MMEYKFQFAMHITNQMIYRVNNKRCKALKKALSRLLITILRRGVFGNYTEILKNEFISAFSADFTEFTKPHSFFFFKVAGYVLKIGEVKHRCNF